MTTIMMLVSRDFLLDRIFKSLDDLICDREATNLLIMVDGDHKLYTKTRNLVVQSNFREKVAIQTKGYGGRINSQAYRRKRIAALHNEAKGIIKPCDYVFLLEDDGLPPKDALIKLQTHYIKYSDAGFISGLQMGRWLTPYIGGWLFDDPDEPQELQSVPFTGELIEVHASGLYCMLVRYNAYKDHYFEPTNNWGPDIEFGRWLSMIGYKNYMDQSIVVDHYRENNTVINPTTKTPKVTHLKVHKGIWRHVFSVAKN